MSADSAVNLTRFLLAGVIVAGCASCASPTAIGDAADSVRQKRDSLETLISETYKGQTDVREVADSILGYDLGADIAVITDWSNPIVDPVVFGYGRVGIYRVEPTNDENVNLSVVITGFGSEGGFSSEQRTAYACLEYSVELGDSLRLQRTQVACPVELKEVLLPDYTEVEAN